MSNKIRDYKDLLVWQKALSVIDKTIELIEMLPSGPARDIIAKQILGSSTLVCANIAEGHSGGSSREFNRILKIAFREAKETDNWLQVIKRSRKFAQTRIIEKVQIIELENIEVIKMLRSLKKSIQATLDLKTNP
jgi:four helix bundle protein